MLPSSDGDFPNEEAPAVSRRGIATNSSDRIQRNIQRSIQRNIQRNNGKDIFSVKYSGISLGQIPFAIATSTLCIFLMGLTAVAHHSIAGFDINKPITLTGVITKVQLINPHAILYIDVKKNGQLENWALEGSAPSQLQRSGVKDHLTVGTELIATGFRLKPDYAPNWLSSTFSGWNKSSAESSQAMDAVKANRILLAGDLRIGSDNYHFGNGLKFDPPR
jgi:Family of unknown function (DUF6152)